MRKPQGWMLAWNMWTGEKSGVFMDITWGESKANNSCTFINGDGRNFKMHFRDITTDIGWSIGGKNFSIAPFAGMFFRFSDIKSSFYYHTGFTSFGDEKQLNGIFHSLRVVGDWGVAVNLSVGKLAIHGRVDWMIRQGITSSDYSDLSLTKSNAFAPEYLLKDVSQINQIGYPTIIDDTKGCRISLGLGYLLYRLK